MGQFSSYFIKFFNILTHNNNQLLELTQYEPGQGINIQFQEYAQPKRVL